MKKKLVLFAALIIGTLSMGIVSYAENPVITVGQKISETDVPLSAKADGWEENVSYDPGKWFFYLDPYAEHIANYIPPDLDNLFDQNGKIPGYVNWYTDPQNNPGWELDIEYNGLYKQWCASLFSDNASLFGFGQGNWYAEGNLLSNYQESIDIYFVNGGFTAVVIFHADQEYMILQWAGTYNGTWMEDNGEIY